MANIHNLKVGQKVYIEDRFYIIEKIGKKFFYLTDHRYHYNLETLRQITEYSGGNLVTLTLQEYIDKKEHDNLKQFILGEMVWYLLENMSLDQLRKIKQVIEESCKK